MDKTDETTKIRELVNANSTFITDEETGVEGYYEPFIEDSKVGFHFRDHHGREQTIYLEPCTNETLVWLHMNDLDDEEREPECFFTIAKDWPAEGWAVYVNGGLETGIVHDSPGDAQDEADNVSLQVEDGVEVTVGSAPYKKEEE